MVELRLTPLTRVFRTTRRTSKVQLVRETAFLLASAESSFSAFNLAFKWMKTNLHSITAPSRPDKDVACSFFG